jgi:hypothetical protein
MIVDGKGSLIREAIFRFLHSTTAPAVPLDLITPTWIPGHLFWSYLAGAVLVACGACILVNVKARLAATYVGIMVLLLVLFIYLPILFSNPSDVDNGLNYVVDTVAFSGASVVLADAISKRTSHMTSASYASVAEIESGTLGRFRWAARFFPRRMFWSARSQCQASLQVIFMTQSFDSLKARQVTSVPQSAVPPHPRGVRCNMKRIHASLRLLSTLLLAMLVLQGCNALNPLCGSTRPAPSISSLSATTITFVQVEQGFLLTVNGSHIVSSSVVVINGTTLSTQVMSSSQLRVTLTTAFITGPGTASVTINTPSGNSSNLGCTSGGSSQALTLTIT